MLVIKSTNYLLRFVSYSEGDEKGNISLIKNEVLSKSGLIGSMVVSNMFIGYDKSTNPTSITRQTEIDEIKSNFRIFFFKQIKALFLKLNVLK